MFRMGAQTMRDQARLANGALLLWYARRGPGVQRICEAWPEITKHFTDGELRSEDVFRHWVANLVEGEALAALHEIGQSSAPDSAKLQARERVQARLTHWRVRMSRVLLAGIADSDGQLGRRRRMSSRGLGGKYSARQGAELRAKTLSVSWTECRTTAVRT